MSKKTCANQAKTKHYGVIFTCMTTGAIHLEIAEDLTTDSFILALWCFITCQRNVKYLIRYWDQF